MQTDITILITMAFILFVMGFVIAGAYLITKLLLFYLRRRRAPGESD